MRLKGTQYLHSGVFILSFSLSMFSFCLEPVGVKAPIFSTDNMNFAFIRSEGQSITLLCQAQGLPVPLFRYVSLHNILQHYRDTSVCGL